MDSCIKHLILFLLLPLVLLTGCKEFAEVGQAELSDFDSEFAIPLLSARTTMRDLLQESGDIDSMVIDSDEQIRLFYEGDLTARSSSDIFEIIQFAPFEVTDKCTGFDIQLPASIDLDFVNLNGGALSFALESEHEEDVEVIINIPQLINLTTGNEFRKEFTVRWNIRYFDATIYGSC